jgi:hypothetical protein
MPKVKAAAEHYLTSCCIKLGNLLLGGTPLDPDQAHAWATFCESLWRMSQELSCLTLAQEAAQLTIIGSLHANSFCQHAATILSRQPGAEAAVKLVREAAFERHLGPQGSELVVVQAAFWVARWSKEGSSVRRHS